MTDDQRENRINLIVRALAKNPEYPRFGMLWDELVTLIAERSPERVAQMERERGLV